MTRSDDALGNLHLASRGADRGDNHEDHRTSGWKQLLCAWFIVLTVAALFKISDFISANRTAPFAHTNDLAQLADEVEQWERGVPRQRTMTVPNSHNIVMVSRVDQ